MNRGTIRTLTARYVGDPNQTKFTPAQYNTAIDTAQEEFCFDSKALFKDAPTFTIATDDATYDLPTDFWLEKELTHKGLKLWPITRAQLLGLSGDDWTDDEGTPTHYIIDPEEARKQILLYPIPQADDVGANLILTYYPIPAALSADSSTPFNGASLMAQFHKAVAAQAAIDLILSLPQTPDSVQKIGQLAKIYEDKVSMAINEFGNTPRAPILFEPKTYWRK